MAIYTLMFVWGGDSPKTAQLNLAIAFVYVSEMENAQNVNSYVAINFLPEVLLL